MMITSSSILAIISPSLFLVSALICFSLFFLGRNEGTRLGDLGGVSCAEITDGYQKRAPNGGASERGGAAEARQTDANFCFSNSQV